ncbi:DUF5662 family protein [Pseudoalteromonas umbrosa]|uniref:DUF5662 family protein n=1 Tax=Pseudoalteromonas umbrosa TaxID=3048489 RepID=UPI0024C417AD|nr:DUF5662 family protein [Pseudoalteromonas sp. B95]MDK1290116.1 DUF5662 family protein [Pseudoalteromonas sp. B95]
MLQNKNSPTFGDQLEVNLNTCELVTNATTWRHIWFVQRFLLHGADVLMQTASVTKHKPHTLFSLLHAFEHSSTQAWQWLDKASPLVRALVANTQSWLAQHRASQQSLLSVWLQEIHRRCLTHDQSKLLAPEVDAFTKSMERLSFVEFGSVDYHKALAELKPALEHHYAHNRHHPEHFSGGVMDMTLVDLFEMYCDWLASSLRTKDGDIYHSFEVTQKRFNLCDEVITLLKNTHEAHYLEQYRRDPMEFSSQSQHSGIKAAQ